MLTVWLANVNDGGFAVRVAVPLVPVNCRLFTFQPPLSSFRVRICWPAGSVTWVVTVVQFCQPPVAGMLTLPLRFAPAALDRCRAPLTAPGAATLKLTAYVPAAEALTV